MERQMKLYESPFDRIKSGKKRIEIRLFDEKRQSLNLGDIITFSKLPDLNEKINTKVIGLLRYKSFQELVDDFPMSYFGYPDDYDKRAFVKGCYEVYTPEEEKKFGVLGIKIKLV